jgi:hypothetical protein
LKNVLASLKKKLKNLKSRSNGKTNARDRHLKPQNAHELVNYLRAGFEL